MGYPSSNMAAEQIVHEWPPLASDPAMFGKLIEFLGVENYTVNEVWGFDEELLAFLPQPCLAAIGLFMRMPTKKAEDYARGQADFECDYYKTIRHARQCMRHHRPHACCAQQPFDLAQGWFATGAVQRCKHHSRIYS